MAAKKKQTKGWKRVVKRIILLLIAVVVLGVAAFVGYSALKEEYTTTYTGYSATTGSISNALSFSGSLALVDNKTYTAASDATIKQVYVSAGDKVKEGDKLIRLSGGEIIKADFDGTVNTLDVEKDDNVSAGDTLCQLADFDNMTVSVRVDEYDIRSVHVGDECKVTVTSSEESFMSTISKINYISSSSGNVAYYSATCDVAVEEGVYPGMQVSVTIPQESAENVVVLKADALSFDETNQAYVMMYNAAQELERVDVEVGVSNGNYVEIKSGVKSGDTVYAELKTPAMSEMALLMTQMMGGNRVMAPQGQRQYNRENGTAPSGFGGGRP